LQHSARRSSGKPRARHLLRLVRPTPSPRSAGGVTVAVTPPDCLFPFGCNCDLVQTVDGYLQGLPAQGGEDAMTTTPGPWKSLTRGSRWDPPARSLRHRRRMRQRPQFTRRSRQRCPRIWPSVMGSNVCRQGWNGARPPLASKCGMLRRSPRSAGAQQGREESQKIARLAARLELNRPE
jgi:hypothetical protein